MLTKEHMEVVKKHTSGKTAKELRLLQNSRSLRTTLMNSKILLVKLRLSQWQFAH